MYLLELRGVIHGERKREREEKTLKTECRKKSIHTVEQSSHMLIPYLSLKPPQNPTSSKQVSLNAR